MITPYPGLSILGREFMTSKLSETTFTHIT
nr:MAG TPA: hypothetical protein [Caudoviricetes sp.]